MIDTHCHIFSEYYNNIDNLILKIKQEGVKKIIVNGTNMKSNLEVLSLIKKYDIVYGAIGFQPTELDEYEDECLIWLENHICDSKIVAVGEIGLDYHYDNTDRVKQKNVFRKQLEIAQRYNKAVIIHSRDAIQDTYDIISEYKICGSIHCFSGSLEMAVKFNKLGFLLGIGGVVTYKNVKNLIDVIKNVPLEYILLETDAPYLSPEPFRGQVNCPDNVSIIAQKIAEIKGLDKKSVIEATTLNACRLFDF